MQARHKRSSILDIERRLGLLWEYGISRVKGKARSVPVIDSLLSEVEEIKKAYQHYHLRELRSSSDLSHRLEQLFEDHAPHLWPSSPTDTSAWLTNPAQNNWKGLYERSLFYEYPVDRAELRRDFKALCFEKVYRYGENTRQQAIREAKQKKKRKRIDAGYEEGEEEEEEEDDDDDDDDEDDRTTPEDTSGMPDTTSLAVHGHGPRPRSVEGVSRKKRRLFDASAALEGPSPGNATSYIRPVKLVTMRIDPVRLKTLMDRLEEDIVVQVRHPKSHRTYDGTASNELNEGGIDGTNGATATLPGEAQTIQGETDGSLPFSISAPVGAPDVEEMLDLTLLSSVPEIELDQTDLHSAVMEGVEDSTSNSAPVESRQPYPARDMKPSTFISATQEDTALSGREKEGDVLHMGHDPAVVPGNESKSRTYASSLSVENDDECSIDDPWSRCRSHNVTSHISPSDDMPTVADEDRPRSWTPESAYSAAPTLSTDNLSGLPIIDQPGGGVHHGPTSICEDGNRPPTHTNSPQLEYKTECPGDGHGSRQTSFIESQTTSSRKSPDEVGPEARQTSQPDGELRSSLRGSPVDGIDWGTLHSRSQVVVEEHVLEHQSVEVMSPRCSDASPQPVLPEQAVTRAVVSALGLQMLPPPHREPFAQPDDQRKDDISSYTPSGFLRAQTQPLSTSNYHIMSNGDLRPANTQSMLASFEAGRWHPLLPGHDDREHDTIAQSQATPDDTELSPSVLESTEFEAVNGSSDQEMATGSGLDPRASQDVQENSTARFRAENSELEHAAADPIDPKPQRTMLDVTEERTGANHMSNMENQSTPNAFFSTALEGSTTAVYWDEKTAHPSIICLRQCKSHRDLFYELCRRRPSEFKQRTIRAVNVELLNAKAAGITESPDCRIDAEDDDAAFEYMMIALRECTASVRPRLKLIVCFED